MDTRLLSRKLTPFAALLFALLLGLAFSLPAHAQFPGDEEENGEATEEEENGLGEFGDEEENGVEDEDGFEEEDGFEDEGEENGSPLDAVIPGDEGEDGLEDEDGFEDDGFEDDGFEDDGFDDGFEDDGFEDDDETDVLGDQVTDVPEGGVPAGFGGLATQGPNALALVLLGLALAGIGTAGWLARRSTA